MAAAFHFRFIAIAIDIIDRRGPSNKMCRQLQAKKTKVRSYLPFIKLQKTFYPSFITNKTERFSFKSGCVVWLENDEMHHQLQPNKTKVRLY